MIRSGVEAQGMVQSDRHDLQPVLADMIRNETWYVGGQIEPPGTDPDRDRPGTGGAEQYLGVGLASVDRTWYGDRRVRSAVGLRTIILG